MKKKIVISKEQTAIIYSGIVSEWLKAVMRNQTSSIVYGNDDFIISTAKLADLILDIDTKGEDEFYEDIRAVRAGELAEEAEKLLKAASGCKKIRFKSDNKFFDKKAAKLNWKEHLPGNESAPSCETCGSPDITYDHSEVDKEGDTEVFLKCGECKHVFEASLR